MATDSQEVSEQQQQAPKLQIYSTAPTGISPFWREKYERDAKKYWDIFYKRHQDKFFKDRHYLDKEWGSYFNGPEKKVVLEVGCGAGNTIFPLVATYPDIFVHACDFSTRAVDLVKSHKDFTMDHVNAFVCDLTVDDLSKQITPSSVDIVTMIFVLSAVAPEKMTLVLQNIKKVLKPNGLVLLRDYAVGDLAQERFISKDQRISENFYVRGDGTRAFYFSEEFLTNLFEGNGFVAEEIGLCCKQVENRSRELVMNRDGALVKCEISGEVQVNSRLSGLPDLTLSFANPSVLNDVRFHPCVRFRPWESHQILSFVPPDGLFKLMSYRVKWLKNTPIYVKPQITSEAGTCRVSVLVGIRNDPGKTIDSITVQFQLPSCVASADLTSNHGSVNILANKTCFWSIGRIPKDKSPSMTGTLVLETGLERLHVFPTFQVGFKIMGVALSGLQIDKLDLKNLPTRPYKGFRALTRAGQYDVRS